MNLHVTFKSCFEVCANTPPLVAPFDTKFAEIYKNVPTPTSVFSRNSVIGPPDLAAPATNDRFSCCDAADDFRRCHAASASVSTGPCLLWARSRHSDVTHLATASNRRQSGYWIKPLKCVKYLPFGNGCFRSLVQACSDAPPQVGCEPFADFLHCAHFSTQRRNQSLA